LGVLLFPWGHALLQSTSPALLDQAGKQFAAAFLVVFHSKHIVPHNKQMADALRFACQPGCTKCCEQEGFVYLTESDLVRAAEFLGMKPAAFERKYVYRTRHKLRLLVPPDSQCFFLRSDGCSIHPAKPTQCRIFPFWPELVESASEWNKTAQFCPGIGQGPLIQIETVQEQTREMRESHPGMY
jgi:Fe-S-cluster containining protein